LALTDNPRVIALLATLDADASSVPLVTKEILLFLEICAFPFNNVIRMAVLVLTLIHIPENVIARYNISMIIPLLLCVILHKVSQRSDYNLIFKKRLNKLFYQKIYAR